MGDDTIKSANLVSFANLESPGLREDSRDTALSECLYRTICLIAYGNGNGCFEDIDSFISIGRRKEAFWDIDLEETRYGDYYTYKVVLPYARQCNEQPLVGDLKIPKDYRNPLNPVDKIVGASRAIYEDDGYQTFTFFYEGEDSEESEKWACNVAGQLIINAHVTPIYIGIYDGKPLFEPSTEADRLWLAFAELKKHQFPGICAVCGKAINRKREPGGGKPQKTCKEHSDKFQNIKKSLKKKAREIDDTSMTHTDVCEMAARAQRVIRPELNERPLMYPGIEDLSYTYMSADNLGAGESEGDQQ